MTVLEECVHKEVYCLSVSQHECTLGEGVCLCKACSTGQEPTQTPRWAWAPQQEPLLSLLWFEQTQSLWPRCCGVPGSFFLLEFLRTRTEAENCLAGPGE